jgi:hypothetical protein
LPSELVGELATFAMRLGTDIPTTWAALIDIGVEQKLLRMSAEEKRAVLAEREVRIPVMTTMRSGAWRPLDPVDDDQGGA